MASDMADSVEGAGTGRILVNAPFGTAACTADHRGDQAEQQHGHHRTQYHGSHERLSSS
ncbi:hypothetical protein GCM10028795_02710 [Lysobacter olei]